jgi:hypothetical protein
VAAIGLGLWVAQRQRWLEAAREAAQAMAQRLALQQGALLLICAVYAVAEKVKSHADETALDLLHLSLELEGVTSALVSVDHAALRHAARHRRAADGAGGSRKLLAHLQRAYDLSLDGRGHKWAPVKEFAEQASEAVKPPMEAFRNELAQQAAVAIRPAFRSRA